MPNATALPIAPIAKVVPKYLLDDWAFSQFAMRNLIQIDVADRYNVLLFGLALKANQVEGLV